MCTGLGLLELVAALAGDRPEAQGFPNAALFLAAAGALSPTLRCRGDRAIQPRPALRRLWAVIRLFWLGYGVLLAGYNIADYAQGGNSFDHRALAKSVSPSFLRRWVTISPSRSRKTVAVRYRGSWPRSHVGAWGSV